MAQRAIPRPINPFLPPELFNPAPIGAQSVPMQALAGAPRAVPTTSEPAQDMPWAANPAGNPAMYKPMGAPQAAAASAMPMPQGGGGFLSGLNNFLGSDASLAMAAGMLGGGSTSQALGRGFGNAFQARQKEAPATTDDIKEFSFAKQSGYDKDFPTWMREKALAGSQKTIGAPPAGYRYEFDEYGNPTQAIPVAGSPAAQEAEAAAGAADTRDATAAEQAGNMLSTIGEIKGIFENANTPVTGTASVPYALYSGSPAGKVRSYVKTLQSNVAIETITKMKAASATGATGFGALSERELDILLNVIGSLDPDTTDPEVFKQSVDFIDQKFTRIAKEVSPERQREFGLDRLLGTSTASGAPDLSTMSDEQLQEILGR